MLRKIKNLYVLHNYNTSILKIIYIVDTAVVSLFFGIFFWIIKFLDYHDFFYFLNHKQRIKKFFLFSYSFILLLLIIFIYPFSILLNIIGFIEEIIRRDYDKLQDHIKDYIRLVFH